MSTIKTRAEMDAASEFIQYLEELRSGSLGSSSGTNRVLERLAENDNVLLQELARVRLPLRLAGGFELAGGTLQWSSTLALALLDPITGTVLVNTVAAGSVAIAADEVAYVVIDRATNLAALAAPVAVTVAAFATLLAGSTARLDYIPIAMGVDSSVLLANGQWLRSGYAITNGGATDTQYGQQTEVSLLRTYQKENLNLRMVGGDALTWDASGTTLSWSSNLVLTFPFAVGGNRILGPASVSIPADSVWYGTLSRSPAGSITISTGVASLAAGVPDSDNTFVLAVHHGADNRLYLADGTAISDGETVRLGGVRTGVQWIYREVGSGLQVLDFAAALGSSTAYQVGTGELMVFRNGIKAIPAAGKWQGGAYPTGSYVGTAPSGAEDYIEEDVGDGSGERIIWLADGQAASEPLFYPAATHDPALEWPATDDYVEAFIGVQGRAPVITLPDGLYGFERVWASGPSEIKTHGGYLITDGERWSVTGADALTLSQADMLGTEVLDPGAWHYVYVGPSASTATPPDFKLSTQPPDVAGSGPGTHPDYPTYRFLSSVNVRAGGGLFHAFSKQGSSVVLGRYIDAAAAFAAAVTGSYEPVDLSTFLPAGVGMVRLRVLMTAQAAVTAGDLLLLSYKHPDFSAPGLEAYSIKPATTNATIYEFDVLLDEDQQFDFNVDPADFQNVASAHIIGYAEGRHTSGEGLL